MLETSSTQKHITVSYSYEYMTNDNGKMVLNVEGEKLWIRLIVPIQ